MSPAKRSELLRRSLAAGAIGAGAVLSMRVLLRPQETETRRLIDWEAARRVAYERSGESWRTPPLRDRDALSARYTAMAAELAPLLGEVCDRMPFDLPAFRALDRRGFIDVNITIVRRLVEPIERLRATVPESIATALGRRMLDRYVGELLGLMARRVLGQYDPVLMLGPPDPADTSVAALYLVEPNVSALEREQRLPGDALRRWLILHELTHAWQFAQHAWLREHITGLMRAMMVDSVTGAGGSPLRSRELLARLPETVRTQLRGVAQVQAVMSVLEGYSNYVMHTVGKRHIEHFDELEAAMQRRRQQRTALERLVLAITGLELKMRQYELGEKFCVTVVARSDLATLNKVWNGPEAMPSLDELRNPARWLRRVT